MNDERRLESWKEIGLYLQKDLRTARRWEKEEGLPIHRHSHKSRSSVYAYASEIDRWRASRKVVPEPPPPLPLWKTLLAPPRSLAVGVTLALCLVMVGNGIRPQAASAQGAAPVARQVWDRGGSDQVSVDGRYIPYPDWQAGGTGIHDLVTGTDRILRTGEQGEVSVISPDNSQIAYIDFDEPERRYRLRILDLRGANQKPRNLMRDREPPYLEPLGWTPDGKEVLVIREQADGIWQIGMISVANGITRVLKSLKWRGVDARISPDGRFIAYCTPADGQPNARDIFVLATDGSGESVVVKHPADDYGMVWSPDGSKILFLSDRTGGPSLWAAPVTNGKPTGAVELVKANFSSRLLGMARNGTLYYLVSGRDRQNVYRAELNPDGKALKYPMIATDGFVNANRGGDVSPDGQSIVYYSNRPQTTVVVRNLKTGEERVVPAAMQMGSFYFQGPKWFPDGRSVLVEVTTSDERPKRAYFRLDVATGRSEDLRIDGGLAVPAPTGNTIYYRENIDRLVRHDLDIGSSMEIALVKNGLGITEFSVSPDGKQVAYTVNGLEPGSETKYLRYIAIIPASGGEPREVHHHSNNLGGPSRFNALEWTPDQKYLLFVEEERVAGSAIWRVPAAGGQAEKIGVTMNARIKSPFIHPDGKSIFFTAVESDNNEVWALENFLPAKASTK